MLTSDLQCTDWYAVEATRANIAIVDRVIYAAVYLRRRIYRQICQTSSGPGLDALWQRHSVTYDWQHRTTARRLTAGAPIIRSDAL